MSGFAMFGQYCLTCRRSASCQPITDSPVPPQNTNPDSAAMAAQSKSADDIIKSAKFPAAHAPRPNETPKIETDYWPCPPSLAALGRPLPLVPLGHWWNHWQARAITH